ncbi:hypothetical protein ABW19_dt0200681 [Dactylella cylindrospora]|nr:hypothetical protein ABW19_dt0200681 [Dactylella cylindrospora]
MSQSSLPTLARTPSMSRGLSSTPQPATNGISSHPVESTVPEKEKWDSQRMLTTNYSIRIKQSMHSALITPILQVATSTLPPRSARRGQTAVNYAEDDDDDFEDRGDRRGGAAASQAPVAEDVDRPIDIPGKPAPLPLKYTRSPEQIQGAAQLPKVPIPVILDLNLGDRKVRDAFLWNLFEGDVSFERFARQLCIDLDLDQRKYADEIISTMRNTMQDLGPAATFPFPDPYINPITGEENNYTTVIKISHDLRDVHFKDQFEWNLFGNAVTADNFARTMCAELGLHGEHVPVMVVAVHAGILQAKKELIEAMALNTTPNETHTEHHPTNRHFRYNAENLGADWGPNVEKLSKEEMERKENDRERSSRRQRRETAKVAPATPAGAPLYVFGGGGPDTPGTPGAPVENFWKRKQKRAIREESPMRRGSGSGPGGGVSAVPLADSQLNVWRCSHCSITGQNVWGVRDGPDGKATLCAVCGYLWNEDDVLPAWRKSMFLHDMDPIH